jgi:hypothetical protein
MRMPFKAVISYDRKSLKGAAEARADHNREPQTEMGAGIAASPHLRRAKDLPVFVSLN